MSVLSAVKNIYLAIFRNQEFADKLGGSFVLFCLVLSAVFVGGYWLMTGAEQILHFPSSIEEPIKEDLAAFYRAGQMAAQGRAVEAYDVEAFREPLSGHAKTLVFRYPPHFLPFAEVLAPMSYAQAKALGLILSVLALASIPLLLKAPSSMAFFFVFSGIGFHTLTVLNNSALTIFLIVLALVILKKGPVISGILLGVASLKPQYGVLVPVFLLANGHYRAIFAACLTILALLALTALLYGADVMGAYVQTYTQEPYVSYMKAITPGFLNLTALLGKIGIEGTARVLTYLQVVMGLLWLQPMIAPVFALGFSAADQQIAYSILPTLHIILALLMWTWQLWRERRSDL
ncbi:glycosyltransferase family 87 protein [Roseibium algae]|uniref:Glycosyltransferase family 87 protein n=1 Tax=Roseibium algae TaxID=3123038 RepID=A0ABU8TJN2_9HYPH